MLSRVFLVASALLLCATTTSAAGPAIVIVPAPQLLRPLGGTVATAGWPVGFTHTDAKLAPVAQQLAKLTGGKVVALTALQPATPGVAVGIVRNGSSSLFDTMARQRGITPDSMVQVGPEGYALDISREGALLAATTDIGLFYGYQTLRQLVDAGSAPAVRVEDWPSTPVRGAFMFGMPDFKQGAAPHDDPGVQWMIELADYMASLKLNYGVVTDGFWEWLETMDGEVLAKLQAIKAHFDKNHIAFVPSLSSGSGGQENGESYATLPHVNPENTAEGVWVRNLSFTFDSDGSALPDVGPFDLGIPENGNFTGEVSPKSGAPRGWRTQPGTLNNNSEWSRSADSPFGAGGGSSSMRCEVSQPPGGSSSFLYSDNLNVTGGQMLQLQFWAKLAPGYVGDFPKFELIVPPWPEGGQPEFAEEIDIGGASTDDVRLLPLPGKQLSAHMAEWTQVQYTFRVPANSSTMYIMVRLQGKSTATFWVSGIHFVLLDTAMRNIIRTGATDVEIYSNDGRQYKLGTDFTVVNPKCDPCNTAHHLYLDALPPYEIRRVAGGAIGAGERVRVSFDYLPGKVNQAGHSTPSAFGEPDYYELLEFAINHTMAEFMSEAWPHSRPKMLNFDHDEIRGMARDSRSLRTGLSNAELLARDLNRMQTMVARNDPQAHALFWDGAITLHLPGHTQSHTHTHTHTHTQHCSNQTSRASYLQDR